ncbi:MAG: PQQ-binding-like beta-propeller repeat protein [Armatimonadota bacterium]|jgi:outer membrane protein assembly factor BamB
MSPRATTGWIICLVAALVSVAGAGPTPEQQAARQILDATGVRGGLIVHLGCGDGKLTAALRQDGKYLVQGLDADAGNVRVAREHVRSLGLYGGVSVDQLRGGGLPYADNLVNLLVVEDLGEVRMAEARRVVAPDGVAYIKVGREWTKSVKPRPGNTDEWTHYLHDASGNAVANDEMVGPPRYLQWVQEPRYTRSHEHIPSIYAVVSTGGRIFYIADQTPVASLRTPSEWELIARDAYNGTLLWERPVGTWFPHIVNWGQTPPQLERRLVAVGDRVYVTLGLHSPLSAVDAATGEAVKVYENTRGTEEIIHHKGTLLLAVRSVTDERVAELAKWPELMARDGSPLYARESAQPLITRLRRSETQAEVAILALDPDTGSVLWRRDGDDVAGLRTLSLRANGDRVFYQKGADVVCVDLRTGEQVWSEAPGPLRVVCDSSVICADGKTVKALSPATGQVQWTQDTLLTQIRDAFVINGSVWLGGFKPIEGKRSPAWGPYFATQRDLGTGEVLKHIEPENPGHHHRCYQNKATLRYILGGRRGTEFIDLASGEVLWNSWARGVCRYGVMPCNGLLYTPPHACGCYIGAKLTGFNALAAEKASGAAPAEAAVLERGPAYDVPPSGSPALGPDDWPTYRYDGERSGRTPTSVPAAVRPVWEADVGGKLTSPTVAGRKVFVASVDEHRVWAINADSGEPVWRFTAGARVDSPPTVHQGRAIFGGRDGYVYSVRASDGALAWRLRAAREDRRIAARGQLESASPVIGSVLVRDGAVYCTAGRSSYLDGGIDLCRVEPETGRALSRTAIYSPDPETGRQPPQSAPAVMPGARADILSADDGHVYLRDLVFSKGGSAEPEGAPHLFTLTDFLDGSWTHRSYWIYGTRPSISTGCSGRAKNLIYGRLLVFDAGAIYGYGRRAVHWSSALEDGPYRLFAVAREDGTGRWEAPVGIRVRAMVLADKVLFVAGLPGGELPVRDESRGGVLVAISTSDGAELARCRLPSPPVFDGMAAAYGRLHICTTDGRVLCLSG